LPIGINEPIEVRSGTLMGSSGFRRFGRSRASTRNDARSGLRFDRLAACVRKAPAAVRRLFARLEKAFASFAHVPYHDARTLRELEQMSDDPADWPEETRPRR
jgi:hypothetical protein